MLVIDNANQSHRSKQHSFSSFKNSKNKPNSWITENNSDYRNTAMSSLLTNVK